MVLPRLLHPVDVIIQRKDDASTFVDDDYREPIQQSARFTNITLPGQIAWFYDDRLMATRAGIDTEADGYVLFRYYDLRAAGVTLQLNDRFIKLGHVDTDLYVVQLRHEGHYRDQGGPGLVKAAFRDRTPSRQNRGAL